MCVCVCVCVLTLCNWRMNRHFRLFCFFFVVCCCCCCCCCMLHAWNQYVTYGQSSASYELFVTPLPWWYTMRLVVHTNLNNRWHICRSYARPQSCLGNIVKLYNERRVRNISIVVPVTTRFKCCCCFFFILICDSTNPCRQRHYWEAMPGWGWVGEGLTVSL